jgi:Ca2+-transporting ATPase
MIKSAKYLLSCNIGEIFTILISVLLKLPLPLIPLQILMINLLTDALPALGLGLESADSNVMKRHPRDPKEKPINRPILISIILMGIIMGSATLFMFIQYLDTDLRKAQTVAFTTLVMVQLFAVMSSRSLTPSWEKLNPFSNLYLLGGVGLSLLLHISVVYWPPFQLVFSTVPLSLNEWGQIIGISSFGFIIMEISKIVTKLLSKSPGK